MKLLLTSTGLTHPEVVGEFLKLIERPVGDVAVGFVPVAARTESEIKYIQAAKQELIDLGTKKIIDINFSAGDEDKLKQCDVMYVCGGNTFHLLNEIRNKSFDDVITEFIQDGKLYVGVSAGTIVVTPSIEVAQIEPADENDVGLTNFAGLSVVDFEISPHTPEVVSYENVEKYMQDREIKLYAISDKTALKVEDNSVEVIGEKIFKIYN